MATKKTKKTTTRKAKTTTAAKPKKKRSHIDWNDFAGRLIYQITQEGKNRFLVDLSRNSLRGMIRFAKQGSLLGSATPYGYERLYFDASGEEMRRVRRGERFRKPRDSTAKLVPSADLHEVETVRWLVQTFATTDCSARWMAVDLNRRNVPSPNGGQWDFTHIKNILEHPVYIGWLTYGRRSAGLYHHVGADGEISPASRNGRDHDGYAPIVVPDNHEPLVDITTFESVQAELDACEEVDRRIRNSRGFTSNQRTHAGAVETFGRSRAGSGDPGTALGLVPTVRVWRVYPGRANDSALPRHRSGYLSRHRRVYPGGALIRHSFLGL